MNIIIPAIIPESKTQLESQLQKIKKFTTEIQIDLVDGVFAPIASWPYKEGDIEELKNVDFLESFLVEVDLMVMHPEEMLSHCMQFSAKKVVVHLESTEKMDLILAERDKFGFKLGLSISNDTPLENLFKYIEHTNYVQLMGIAEIGTQGQPFDVRVLDRIRQIKDKNPDIEISIDGSVNKETLLLLKQAGATRFVSGSAILGVEDSQLVFEKLALI